MGVSVFSRIQRQAAGHPLLHDWLSFFAQALLVTSVELSDEFARGMIAQSDSHTGAVHAQDVVRYEAAHGFWVEPAWQQFFERTHHLLGLTITWQDMLPVFNSIYVFGHIIITFLFAVWVFFYRRAIFAFVRNIIFVTNALALVLYESYPLAPPRLARGLTYDHRPFSFYDTLFAVLKDGKVVGTRIGFNEFAAMPSVHIAWSVIAGVVLAFAFRSPLLKLLALLYPLVMLVTVVVTGNHYLMDAVGAVGIVLLATVAVTLFTWWRQDRPAVCAMLRRAYLLTTGQPLPEATAQTQLSQPEQPRAVA